MVSGTVVVVGGTGSFEYLSWLKTPNRTVRVLPGSGLPRV